MNKIKKNNKATNSKAVETLDSGQKVYNIQGKNYTMKKRIFEIRKGSLILTQKLNQFFRDECNLDHTNIKEEDIAMYLVIFYSDEKNIRELLNLALEKGNEVNLDLKTLDELTEMTNLCMNLSNDFFSISGNMNMKFKK